MKSPKNTRQRSRGCQPNPEVPVTDLRELNLCARKTVARVVNLNGSGPRSMMMTRNVLLLWLLGSLILAPPRHSAASESPLDLANPLVGTAASGQTRTDRQCTAARRGNLHRVHLARTGLATPPEPAQSDQQRPRSRGREPRNHLPLPMAPPHHDRLFEPGPCPDPHAADWGLDRPAGPLLTLLLTPKTPKKLRRAIIRFIFPTPKSRSN